MPATEIAALGLTSGATEALPLSNDAHLALLHLLVGIDMSPWALWAVRLGAWVSMMLFVRQDAFRALLEAVRGLRHPALLPDTRGGRDAVAIALGTGSTAVVALSVRGQVSTWGNDPTLVGACLLVTAVALGSTLWAPAGDRDVPTRWGAVMVGVAQGAAVLPGLSRTAVALTSLLWLGLRPARSFQLCFLMWLPAGLLYLAVDRPTSRGNVDTAVVAALASAVGTALGLHLLRAITNRRALPVFSLYLVPLGVATLAWGYARP